MKRAFALLFIILAIGFRVAAQEVVVETATPTEAIEYPEEAAAIHYNRAIDLHMAQRLDEAIIEYRQAVLLDPGVAAYYADMGEAYRMLGERKLAIEAMEKAIELDPALSNAYTTLGVIYDEQDLLTKSIEYHRKAIQIDPGHYIAYNNLGHAYDRLGLIDAAIANYKKAIEIQYNFAPAYDNLGTDYLNMGRPDEGIEAIQKAINFTQANDPQLALYYNDLGAAFVMKKEYTKAYGAFKTAVDLAPYNQDIARNFSFIKEYLDGKQ